MTGSESFIAPVIEGRLYQSGRPIPLSEVEALGVNAVIDVGFGAQPWIGAWMAARDALPGPERPQQRVFVHVPLIDAAGMLDVRAADAAISVVVNLLKDPERVLLVHCDMGAFRSVHVTAAALAVTRGLSVRDATMAVDVARGHGPYRETALSAPDWAEHARTYDGRPPAIREVEDG